jgi:hypothetical protein
VSVASDLRTLARDGGRTAEFLAVNPAG